MHVPIQPLRVTLTALAVLLASSFAAAETLATLVSEALANHPAISAAEASARAAEESVAPAGTWPDPMVGFGITNVGATDWSLGDQAMSQVTLQATQRIPWIGKLALRDEIADAGVRMAEARVAAQRDNLSLSVARKALAIYRLDGTLGIEASMLAAFRQMSLAAEGRVAVGAVPQDDLVSIMLDTEASQTRIHALRNRRPGLVANVNELLDRSLSTRFDSLAAGELPDVPTDTAALAAMALRHRPRIALAREMVAQAEDRRLLAIRNRIPDPVATARYGYRGDKTGVYHTSVGIALPIWMGRRQDAAVRAAGEVLRQRELLVRSSELETAGAVVALVARLDAGRRLLGDYEARLIPRAGQLVSARLASYTTGRTSLIAVLDAVRRLQRLRLQELGHEVAQRLAFVELEHVLGHAADIATGTAPYTK